jgi:hypothetical protein
MGILVWRVDGIDTTTTNATYSVSGFGTPPFGHGKLKIYIKFFSTLVFLFFCFEFTDKALLWPASFSPAMTAIAAGLTHNMLAYRYASSSVPRRCAFKNLFD